MEEALVLIYKVRSNYTENTWKVEVVVELRALLQKIADLPDEKDMLSVQEIPF